MRAGAKPSSSQFLLRLLPVPAPCSLLWDCGGGGGRIIMTERANASMAFTVCQACPTCFLCVSSFDPLTPCEVSTGSPPGEV